MAMTRAEKEQLAELEGKLEEVRTWLALTPTPRVNPDVPPPGNDQPFGTLTKGFLPSGSGQFIYAEPACSSSLHHGNGQQERTTSQQPRALYSTELLALRAARNKVEWEAAQALRRLDKKIAELEEKQ